MANFSDLADWIIQTLTEDSDLADLGVSGAWFNMSPEGTASPTIILQLQTDAYTYTLGNKDAYDRHWLSIKCVDESLDGGHRARQVMQRVRQLLNLQQPTLPEGRVMNFKANTGFEYGEQEAGNEQFYHVGTVFVAWLSE